MHETVLEDTVLDEWMRTQYKEEEESQACTSRNTFEGASQNSLQQPNQLHNLNGLLGNSPISPLIQTTLSQQQAVAAAAVAAAAQQFLQPQSSTMNSIQRNQQLNAAHLLSAASKCQLNTMSSGYDSRGEFIFCGCENKS